MKYAILRFIHRWGWHNWTNWETITGNEWTAKYCKDCRIAQFCKL